MTELVDVTVSGPNAEWAAEFARGLLSERLCACVNIVPGVRSLYRWDGAVQDDSEAVLVVHTRAELVAAIIEYADQHHPDDTPQVLAVPVVEAHPGYQQWVRDETV